MKQDMLNSQIDLKSQAPRVNLPSKFPYVCPILNLWIITSSRRGKQNMLITFTHGYLQN